MSGVDRTEGDINFSARRAQWQQEHLSAKTRELLDEDAQYFLHQALSTPCLNALESCSGSELIDLEGRAILDFHGNSAHHVGYGHPKVVQAVRDQLATLSFSPRRYTNRVAVELARRLSRLAPMTDARVLFAPGGAAAISMALKLARIATKRHKTISWWGAFHGATLDAISIGGEDMFREGVGPLLPGAFHVPPPGADEASAETSLDQIAAIMEREGDIAAFIAEPVRCTKVVQPPASYWQGVRELCDRHGALLIFDEIPIGLGRTGQMFACEYAGIAPDMVCLGKGLGGGIVPMAALVARGALNVAAASSIGHFTHEKSPIGAAAALATLEVIADENLLERANTLGVLFAEQLRTLQSRYAFIREVRQCGMLFGVELRDEPQSKQPAAEIAEAALYACLKHGLSFKISSGTVLTLAPPLTIREEDLLRATSILDQSFRSLLTSL